jgi:cytochrome oxidase Cu insertion factor (SCO1/SenC/PrrC family)
MRKLIYLISSALMLAVQLNTALANGEHRFDEIRSEFELLDASGERVTEQDFRGRYVLLAFGFTHCLHICPMMAANMAMALKASQKDAVGVFISVDSERDSPVITHAYASSFHPSMIGLGGSFEQISQAANNFNISFVVTKSQKAYTVEHTSDIFLIAPDGEVLEVFALNASPTDMAKAMNPPTD